MFFLIQFNLFLSVVGPYNKNTMRIYTGLNIAQFDQVLRIVMPSLLRVFKTSDKSKIALYIFLMRLKTGQTYNQIAPLFYISRITVGSWIRKVRDILHKNFVTLHLYKRKRQDLISNTTPLSRMLYQVSNQTAVVCWDATYVFTVKSSNFGFQKKTYSMQHERNLLKFMLCVTTNGFIAAVYGPFEAKKNDAVILNIILNEPGNIFEQLLPGDVMVVDRGFRDCIQTLKNRGFQVKVPKGTPGNTMTKLDANISRLATKTRFVIEVRNSHIKAKWKHLSGTKIHQSIPHLKKDFEICASLVNAFCSKIVSDENDWQRIGNSMLNRLNQQCLLPSIVHLIPANSYIAVSNLTLFPKYTYQDMKNISHGSYQIRLARSYCQAHVKANNGIFIIKVCDANVCQKFCGRLLVNTLQPLLLLLELKSRFRANMFHRSHVLLSLDLNGKYIVNEYCCSCRHGRRTVGCCSHVMLIIWYTLFVDQTKAGSLFPSSNLDDVFNEWGEMFSSDSDISSDLDNMSETSESSSD